MMNLLVVDDEYLIAESISDSLRCDDLELDSVFCAYSVQGAKDILDKNEVEILITDVEMPGESGLDLLRWMEQRKLDPVKILLTAHKKFEYAYNAMQHNCIKYLLKPVSIRVIKMVVQEAIDKRIHEKVFDKWWSSLTAEERIRLTREETTMDIVNQVKKVVRENISSLELNRMLIANRIFLNEDYLSYIFHKKSGETLNSFIVSERIRKVKSLLLATDYSIDVVACKAGFSDATYMRKVFKKREQVSPTQYRKNLLEQKK